MMRPDRSLSPNYFERMFAKDRDPWHFETSPYEALKFDTTIAALGNRSYRSGFEVGCANGVLTARLAKRCETLLAIDVSASALSQAKRRCGNVGNITFAEMTFPVQQPAGTFDLIVLSEVAYYWDKPDLDRAGDFIASHTDAGADLLLVHWIGPTNYPHSGDDAVALLRARIERFDVVHAERHDKYRLDLWRKF